MMWFIVNKYYEVIYILFHIGMRISEFCGLTMRDIDLEKRTINIEHQLQRISKREYVIEPTKTNTGTRIIPMTNEVTEMFRAIILKRLNLMNCRVMTICLCRP